MSPFRILLRFLSSNGLASAIFVLLLLLTYLGTLYQVDSGLHAAQQRFFYAWAVIVHLLGILPVALPGGKALLSLLFVNLLLGGVIQARKGWRQTGVLVAHVGILVLLAGGFAGERLSTRGFMRLYEGERSGTIQSYDAWEVVISGRVAAGTAREFIIPEDRLTAAPNGAAVFTHDDLPFDVRLSHYQPNARPMPDPSGARRPGGDGVWLAPQPLDNEPRRNIPAVQVAVQSTEGELGTFALWGLEAAPASLPAGDAVWFFGLRKRTWPLPFSLTLEAFLRELHPGTSMPRAFSSRVVCHDEAGAQPALINMNNPLRHKGYAVYQSSWGPQDAPPGTPLFSVFEIASNPADRFPIIACVIIAAGMLLHFTLRLARYLQTTGRKPA